MESLNISSLLGMPLADFQASVQRQIKNVVSGTQLKDLESLFYFALKQKSSLLVAQVESRPNAPNEGWGWLVPLIYEAAGGSPDLTLVSGLAAVIDCLEVANKYSRQHYSARLKNGSGSCSLATLLSPEQTGRLLTDKVLENFAGSLLLEVVVSKLDSVTGLAMLKSFNRLSSELTLGLYEELEQYRAELANENIYVVSIGRGSAGLAEGAAWLAALAALSADSNPARLADWGKFGFNLGITAQFLADLEFYSQPQKANDSSLKNLPLLYALNGESEVLPTIAGFGLEWLAKCQARLNNLASLNYSAKLQLLLASYKQRLEVFSTIQV